MIALIERYREEKRRALEHEKNAYMIQCAIWEILAGNPADAAKIVELTEKGLSLDRGE